MFQYFYLQGYLNPLKTPILFFFIEVLKQLLLEHGSYSLIVQKDGPLAIFLKVKARHINIIAIYADL